MGAHFVCARWAGHDCSDCGPRDASTRSAHVVWRRKLEAQRQIATWVNYTTPDGKGYRVKRGSLLDKDMMHEIALGKERGHFTDFNLPMEMMVLLDLYNTTTRAVQVTPELAFKAVHKHSGDYELASAVAHGNYTIQSARRKLQMQRGQRLVWAQAERTRVLRKRMREEKTAAGEAEREAMHRRAEENKEALHRGGYKTAPELRKEHPEVQQQGPQSAE